MTNTDVAKHHQRKRRNWRDGAMAPADIESRKLQQQLLQGLTALDGPWPPHLTPPPVAPRPSLVQALPTEMLAVVLGFLDGHSLLRCARVARALARLTHDRDVWKNICMQRWPTLRAQVLPQLPGAPDYDLIRLYGGSWRRCFVADHARDQRAELRVAIPQFRHRGPEKVVSETFAIGEHRFCLWIFPRGNPNEPQYKDHVLSVYLVLTDLDRRPRAWLTCAVFSLAVLNHRDPTRTIEWHSCLVDNKFDPQLNNWGVHSLGALPTLRDPAQGFVREDADDTLTVHARVRLMSITFRLVFERHLRAHRHLGLADLAAGATLTLPFCASLHDLLARLRQDHGVDPASVRIWCFNQPVVSGQALRPRKLLTRPKVDRALPMFGNLLCDGVDIDAYSFCQLYIEDPTRDPPPLDELFRDEDVTTCWGDLGAAEMMEVDEPNRSSTASTASSSSSSSSLSGTSSAAEEEDDDNLTVVDSETTRANATSSSSNNNNNDNKTSTLSAGYLFVKVLQPDTLELAYLGRLRFDDHLLTTSAIYECVARHVGCSSSEVVMYKEEIAPTVYSGPIPWSTKPISSQAFEFTLSPADVVVFTLKSMATNGTFDFGMRALLHSHYLAAERMFQAEYTSPTLEKIENLAERLDIPKFRVRSAFRKCKEDGRLTLRYIMEGRHLGFICDSCGETDFKGPRYNCTVCNDYDLCQACHARSYEVSHRYANVDGKWQRIYDFKDHKTTHAMREMLPVFYQYEQGALETKPSGIACNWARAW